MLFRSGVWFPYTPEQVPWERYLDEAARAGYTYTELGPFGYNPTDPARLRDELAKRNLTLTGATVGTRLQRGRSVLQEAKDACKAAAETIKPQGAEYLIILPEGTTDLDGKVVIDETLTPEEWKNLTSLHDELGKYCLEELGCKLVYHSHADSHVGTQDEIARLLNDTDPRYVNLCLDTGHVAYCNADNLALIMFVAMFFVIFCGYPVAFVLGGTGLIFAFIGWLLGVFNLISLNNINLRMWGGVASDQIGRAHV